MRTGIALGSNLGDRLQHLHAGRDFLLTLHDGPSPAAISPVYETTPVDCPPDSPVFYNAVMEIHTHRQPAEILDILAGMEKKLGRLTSPVRNAPRPLDLDLLYSGEQQINLPHLILPHPRMTQRRFVLEPLDAIRPDLILPGHSRRIRDYLRDLPADNTMRTIPW